MGVFVVYDGSGNIVSSIKCSLADADEREAAVAANVPSGCSSMTVPEASLAVVNNKGWKVAGGKVVEQGQG